MHSPAAEALAATPGWRPPSRAQALGWWLRTRLLALRHGLREAWRPSARRWPAADLLVDAPMLGRCRLPLWDDGRVAQEFPLVAGKVQNLRVARRAFHAVEVPAGAVLSFWRQLGRPTARRGFTVGREVRAGCVVPTLAGGICQLSNALATAASRAGLTLVERHGHTARIEAAAAGADDAVDATVFWNYIDLKLRADHAWRIEVELGATELVLTLRGHAPPALRPLKVQPRAALPIVTPAKAGVLVARGCLSCDQHQCFRHQPEQAAGPQAGRVAVLLDAWSPEFAAHLRAEHPSAQRFVPVPMRLAFWRARGAGWAPVAGDVRAYAASARRALWQRLWARREGGRRQASVIDGQRWLARTYARRLGPQYTALVVDQGLLPHLHALGVLDGRRIEVLASALPMAQIEARLDAAAKRWPGDASLRDFRADPALRAAEAQALARASRWVTPHVQVAKASAQVPVHLLPWVAPPPPSARASAKAGGAPWLVFPAGALPRKGALELAAALRGLDCRLRVLGAPTPEARARWSGLAVSFHRAGDGDWLADAQAVVLPAHVEHAPRALLRALAAGVAVVATPACGLGVREGVITVEAGDVPALRQAVVQVLRLRAN